MQKSYIVIEASWKPYIQWICFLLSMLHSSLQFSVDKLSNYHFKFSVTCQLTPISSSTVKLPQITKDYNLFIAKYMLSIWIQAQSDKRLTTCRSYGHEKMQILRYCIFTVSVNKYSNQTWGMVKWSSGEWGHTRMRLYWNLLD